MNLLGMVPGGQSAAVAGQRGSGSSAPRHLTHMPKEGARPGPGRRQRTADDQSGGHLRVLFSRMNGALGLALKALDLPLVPGSKARKAPGLVFLTQLGQGR